MILHVLHVLFMGMLVTKDAEYPSLSGNRPLVPFFLLGFIALVIINSLIPIPDFVRHVTVQITGMLLTTALAAMGLETNLMRLKAMGFRPFILGLSASLFITSLALASAFLFW